MRLMQPCVLYNILRANGDCRRSLLVGTERYALTAYSGQ
jgi:hypothetical protein